MDYTEFEKKIGVTFTNKETLHTAFTHRSYLNEHRGSKLAHNERLEFLGDAVLELVVTEYLFRTYPKQTEGDMTAYRSAAVNADTLAKVSHEIGMNNMLLLSKGEAKDTGRARNNILADAFEALVGAIYEDQGYEVARAFIAKYILALIPGIVEGGQWIDSKSKFQEVAQEKTGITPVYRTLKETGPDHDKKFTVGVFLGEKKIAEGNGKSKQEAEQEAARVAVGVLEA